MNYKMKIDNKNIKRILIFKTGAIGDILMTTPFLRLIRKQFPESKIDYFVGNWAKSVLEGNINLDNII